MLVRALAKFSVVAWRAGQVIDAHNELWVAVWSYMYRIRWSKKAYHRPLQGDCKVHGAGVVGDADLCPPDKRREISWSGPSGKIGGAWAQLGHS